MTAEPQSRSDSEFSAPSVNTNPWDWLQLAQVLPRTIGFARRASRPAPGSPVPALGRSPLPLAQAAVDDLFVSIAALRGRGAGMSNPDAVIAEQHAALAVLARAGVERDPRVLFPPPPPLLQSRLTVRRRPGVRFEHLSFPSVFEPPDGLPRAERWRADEGNHIAHAYLLRSDGGPRPWIIALHGAGAGEPVDLLWMGSVRAHRRLGVNVMHVVLPRHGPRSRAASDDRFPGPDVLVNLYGFAQAMSDTRAGLAWARSQGATAIAVHGISLGSYPAALLAGLEPDLDCVIAGTPLVNLVELVRSHAVRFGRTDHELMQVLRDPSTLRLNALMCPLTFPPLPPKSNRFIYAAIADRLTTPEQAVALWEHWDAPETLWLPASHIGAVFARKTRDFVEAALRGRGIVATANDPAPAEAPAI